MIKLSTTKPKIEVYEVKVTQPSCGSASFYVNASAIFELTINDEVFNIVYQNGHSFINGDYYCPSNELEFYEVMQSPLTDNFEGIKAIAECSPRNIDELTNNNAEIAYTAEEVTAIYTAIQDRVEEAQAAVDAIVQENEEATDSDQYVYLIVSTLNDHFSMRFDDDDEADQFIENASEEEYCSIDKCDAMTAHSNYDERLSNFII
ncbi:hypothetical protein [Photobacterium leiognathi]|uniref:hypothetical protein n=1 Tax=Photobacterium leiognathi TaxID=553611 RepID=UPI0029826E66|nr:hypothetical protein [Photobacterium leiognathi]